MELVYLWVEEYKNIKRKGFNFSPRFRCEFKPKYKKDKDGNEILKDDCELIIEENENYVSIFPENINVTAIVGENGSGKSNLLEIIRDMTYLSFKAKNIITLILIDKRYYLLSEYKIKLESELDIIQSKIDRKNIQNDLPFNKINSVLFNEFERHDFNKEYFKLINSHKYSIDSKYINKSFFNKVSLKINYSISELKEFEGMNDYNSRKIFLEKNENKDDEKHTIFLNLAFEYLIFSLINNSLDYEKKFKELKSIISKKENNSSLLTLNKIELIKGKVRNIKNEIYISNKNYYQDDYSKNLFNLIHSFNYQELEKKYKSLFKDYKFDEIEELEKKILEDELLNFMFVEDQMYKVIGYEFINSKYNTSFSNLSTGEQRFLELYTSFMNYTSFDRELDIILFDEPDTYLHPYWQKKFIFNFIEFLKEIYPNKKWHFFLTSHSPYMLSDLPKDNVVFLENGKQSYPFKGSLQTFGANIHTLLSHGFFMKDGLMGEFAKSKIERIKRFYDFTTKYKNRISSKEKIHLRIEKYYKLNKKEFDYISSIIGEPFLQKVIKNYLDELEEIFDKENYKQKRLEKLVEEFGEDTLREYLG